MGEKNKNISHKMMIPFKAYDGDGDYIFISYKHADSHLVYPIIKQFHDRGFNVWHDGGLPQGNNYDIQIANHIKNAFLFVNFITKTTMDCANDEKDYMIKEFNIALNFDKVILPIYLEDVELDGFYLVHLLGIQSIFKHEYGGDEEFFISECIRAFEEKGLKPISSKNVSETPLDSYPENKPAQNTGTIDYGIDLGTDYSCIAKVDGNGTVMVPNYLDNKDLLSSAVWIKKYGTVYVGDIAKNMIARGPENGCVGFKLKMGTDHVYKLKLSGKEMTPVELSAEILKNLRQSVKEKHQKDLRAAVIAVPADFNPRQTKDTIEAAKLAGFKKVILIQEPTAAAMAYGFNHSPENESWLIYDFGDTFDVSILKNIRGEIINIANEGDTYLGGRLIDWDIVDKILVPEVVEETGLSDFDRNNKKYLKAFAKLKNAAEKAKTELSTFETADIEIESLLIDDDGDFFDFEYEMTREELNQVMKPYVDRSIKHCRKALENANLDVSDVSKIILVGKSSLSPYIQHRLVDEFNTTIEFSIDPTTVVARGASVFAGTQIDYTGE